MKYVPDYSCRFRILKGGKISLVVSALVAGSTMTFASPTGGQVTTGSVAISQNGAVTTINQSTDKASINWQSFNIAAHETVNFVQPSASSVTLNRVIGTSQSLIQGAMNANGQVFLINPNGVLFANGSQVNVGGLVASTLNITDANFQAGNYVFEGNSQNSVLNMGTITTAQGGYVAMMGKTVSNEGTIVASMGNVQMASGEKISLNLNGNSLVKLTIDQGTLNALVENKGLIQADGGQVYLTTQALNTILDGMVNNSGVIEAKTLNDVTGKIILFAHGGAANVSGTLDASSAGGQGGRIVVTGEEVNINEGALLTVSGATGGGDVLVGGSWQNTDTSIAQATQTNIAATARLEANAINNGNGGTVVAWSDIYNPASVTRAYGTFEAKGGLNGGNGGRIETSGHILDVYGVSGSAKAINGKAGLWLFDPYEITIANAVGTETLSDWSGGNYTASTTSFITTGTINALLNSDTDVTIQTGDDSASTTGTINMGGTIAKTSGTADVTLRLNANYNIKVTSATIYSGSSSADDTSKGKLNLYLNAGRSGIGGAFIKGSTIRTQGGDFYATGGLSGNDFLIGNLALNGSTAKGANAFYFTYSTMNTNGGDIYIKAKAGNYAPTSQSGALWLETGEISSGAGNIYLIGKGSSVTNQNYHGIYIYPGSFPAAGAYMKVNSTSGNINITGTNSGTSTIGYYGIMVANQTGFDTYVTSSGGDIYMTGYDAMGTSVNGGITISGLSTTITNISSTNGDVELEGLYADSTKVPNGHNLIYVFDPVSGNNVYLLSEDAIYIDGIVSATQNLVIAADSFGIDPYNAISANSNSAIWLKNSANTTSLTNAGYVTFSGCDYYSASCGANDLTTGKWLNLGNSTPIEFTPSASTTFPGVISVNYSLTEILSGYTYNGSEYTLSNLWSTTNIFDGTTYDTLGYGTDYRFSYNSAGTTGFTNAGEYSNISIEFLNSAYIAVTTALGHFVIDPKALTISGLTSANKVYDGTTTATIGGAAALQTAQAVGAGTTSDGIAYTGDTVSLTGTAVGAFNDKDVADATTVSFSGITLTGTEAGNYTLTSHATAAHSITAKALTISGLTSANKVYDGTTTATIGGAAALQTAQAVGAGTTSDGIAYTGDTVSLTGTAVGAFNDKDVADATTVSFSGITLTGTEAGNYTLTSHATAAHTISKADVTVTASSDTFTYNGSTQFASFSATGLVNNENKSVLSGVSVTGGLNPGTYTAIASGTDGNYNPTFVDGILTILPAPTPESTPDITTIVNQTAVTPTMQPMVTPVTTQPVSTSAPFQIAMGSTPGTFVLVSTTDRVEGVNAITLEDLQRNNPGMNEIRVALGQGSFVELIGGGVKLPDGISQEIYAVNNASNK